ncbi:MAG TPA: DALR domain-containing protein, partial [Virgibacillus sp.]|nr:DALR domain-containing protein [Virgibacillus sp.]
EHRKQASLNLDQDANEWLEKVQSFNDRFEAEMDDDFNTANAIAVLFDLTKEANLYLQSKQTSTNVIQAFQDTMLTFFNVLGIELEQEKELLDEEIEALIQERTEARKNRNFARADEIRDLLKDKDIILEDTAQGIRWKRS